MKTMYRKSCWKKSANCSQVNPDYKGTFLFTNDFPAILEDTPAPGIYFTVININVIMHFLQDYVPWLLVPKYCSSLIYFCNLWMSVLIVKYCRYHHYAPMSKSKFFLSSSKHFQRWRLLVAVISLVFVLGWFGYCLLECFWFFFLSSMKYTKCFMHLGFVSDSSQWWPLVSKCCSTRYLQSHVFSSLVGHNTSTHGDQRHQSCCGCLGRPECWSGSEVCLGSGEC